MWSLSSVASGGESRSAGDGCCELATGSASDSDEAIDIRLRLGDRPSWGSSGEGDCGAREESNSMGSGRVVRPAGAVYGDSSPSETGELSSMIY